MSAAAKTSRFGAARTLEVGARPRRRAYLRFAVTLPAGATIRRAVLRLDPARHSQAVRLKANVAGTTWRERRLRYRRSPPAGARLARWRGGQPGAGYQAVRLRRSRIRAALNTIVLTTRTRRVARFGSREGRHPPQLAIAFSVRAATPPPPFSTRPTAATVWTTTRRPRRLADPGCTGAADAGETYPVPVVVMAAGDIQPASSTAVATAGLLNANPYDALLHWATTSTSGGRSPSTAPTTASRGAHRPTSAGPTRCRQPRDREWPRRQLLRVLPHGGGPRSVPRRAGVLLVRAADVARRRARLLVRHHRRRPARRGCGAISPPTGPRAHWPSGITRAIRPAGRTRSTTSGRS